jgi:hypothetical protein
MDQDLGIGQPGVVIDGDMDIVVADPAGPDPLAGGAAVQPPATPGGCARAA